MDFEMPAVFVSWLRRSGASYPVPLRLWKFAVPIPWSFTDTGCVIFFLRT